MSAAPLVHWHEGLFLQPHHLQRLQRGLGERMREDRRLNWAYPYGIVEARLSADALENMIVRFDRLRAIMPSGLEVNFPEDAEMPALNIKQAFQAAGGGDGIRVLLGVPLWYDARANSAEPGPNSDPRAKLLYRVSEVQAADENTGENAQPMLVRRINARLLLETDDRSDLEVLPLMRIIPAVGDSVGLPRQDPQFAPPCFVLNGSTPLRELARDLASQVEASRRELVLHTTRGGFDWNNLRGLQLEQLWRLRTLNRFAARLPSMVDAPAIAPFTIYLELRALLGELSALQPDRDDFEAPPYDHDAPFLPFYELASKIRGYLRGTVAPSFKKVQFVDVSGLLTGEFVDEDFTVPTEYFLGIQTREDPRRLAQLVEDADRFKLMPRSMAARAIRGVQLKEERFPPLELPAQAGLYYYRLQRAESARAWQQIATEKAAIVRWSGADIPGAPTGGSADYQVTMYMVLPASV